jgi:ADP-L-glycero-D-manno-heptose 6-epimerase
MILLTGGAGFIGSCLLKKLNDEGRTDIIIVDRLGSSGKWKNLVGKQYETFIHKDDFIRILYEDYLPEIDLILHLGACTDTTEQNADYLIENNLNFSIDLAEFAHDNNIRFIYASSAATYGLGDSGYSDYNFKNLRPLNPYGYSKHQFDLWSIKNGYDKEFVGLKFFNVFGPNEYHKAEMSSMVFKAFNQIRATNKVNLYKSNNSEYKDGEQKRDFVYIKDVVNVIMQIIDNKDINGIYNLGSGQSNSWNYLINCVFDGFGLPANIEYIDMPVSIKEQYQNFTLADMSKLSEKLALNFTDLNDSVKDYVQNFLLKDWKYL